jgi:4-hydroxybenzoate polyprenyltransferase
MPGTVTTETPYRTRALVDIGCLLRLARPKHWIKNLIVLFPVIFSMRMGEAGAWLNAGSAAAAFCLVASAVYVINDIRDRDRDRQHPKKANRPIASGRVTVPVASAEAALLLAAGLAVSWAINPFVSGLALAYVALQVSYTFLLKRKMLVDVMCIALGFVIRAAAGAVAIWTPVSPWLIVCTFTVCMFLGFCKRRNEVATLGDQVEAGKHRPTLIGYTPELLTHLITLSAGVAIISYLLYATHPEVVERFHTTYLIYTVPIVIYAVTRFAMLSMEGKYADPTDLITRDWPFQVAAAAWVAVTLAVISWGQHLQEWVGALH